MAINVTCPACNQSVAALDSMAGKKAVCPYCRAVIAVPEFPAATIVEAQTGVPTSPRPPTDHDIPTSFDIATSVPTESQTEDEQAALRIVRLVYVFFRDDWRRLLTCAHLWPVFFLFFLPWVNLSCNGRTLVTQTGLQSVYGAFTVDAKFEKAARNDKAMQNANLLKEQPPWSVLSTLFITFVFLGGVIGLACSVCVLLRLRTFTTATHLFSLGLGGAAFLALAAQMAIGFPIDRHLKQQIEKNRAEQERQIGPGGVRPRNDAVDTWIDIEARYTFWLWLSCVITFISAPTFLLEFGILAMQAVKHHSPQRHDTG